MFATSDSEPEEHHDLPATIFNTEEGAAFIAERKETFQAYQREAIMENMNRYGQFEADETTRKRWTRKMLGELLPHCRFPITNLDNDTALNQVEMYVGNNADARAMLSNLPDVPGGRSLLIRGGESYPFETELASDAVEEFLDEYHDYMESPGSPEPICRRVD
ncbi:Hypothetical protein D9617_19g102500 [Elsinoe fawcettii]|nr:Hypothetical protein D9617_19g102500 [Elsinoe fawcettii]